MRRLKLSLSSTHDQHGILSHTREQSSAPARKHQNADLVYLIAMFSQSVSQPGSHVYSLCVDSAALTHLPALLGQCQRALLHHLSQSSTRNCTHTDCLALASLSLVSYENTQAPKCLTQGTTYQPAKHHAERRGHLLVLRTC